MPNSKNGYCTVDVRKENIVEGKPNLLAKKTSLDSTSGKEI